MEDRLKDAAEETDKERATLKDVAKATTKKKVTAAESVEAQTSGVERDRAQAEQWRAKAEVKLGEVKLRVASA